MRREPSIGKLSRHDLVWLTAAGWARAQATAGANAAAVEAFARHDWPAVRRRREPGLDADLVSLGLPLPPAADGSKRRCAIDVPQSAIARSASPLPLAGIVAVAPPHWRAPLAALLADGERVMVRLSVFGSAAMQALTGERYLTARSDLDVLLRPASLADLHAGLALLLRHAAALPLDGEIVFPGGDAVSWKEWSGAHEQRVLVKHDDGVRLAPKAELLLTLGTR